MVWYRCYIERPDHVAELIVNITNILKVCWSTAMEVMLSIVCATVVIAYTSQLVETGKYLYNIHCVSLHHNRTVLCKYKSAPRVIDIRAASFRHPRREFDIRAASFRSAPRVWGPRREFEVRAASLRSAPRVWGPRREFEVRAASLRSAPRVSNIRAASFKHPRREFQTSAPRVSNIRAASFKHPRREFQTSAPRLFEDKWNVL